MFWHTKRTTDWALLLFGVIALGIVLASAVVVFLFVRTAHDRGLSFARPETEVSDPVDETALFATYRTTLTALRTAIALDRGDMFVLVDDTFFSVRVPRSLLDTHLGALLRIQRLQITDMSEPVAREEILLILDDILGRIPTTEVSETL